MHMRTKGQKARPSTHNRMQASTQPRTDTRTPTHPTASEPAKAHRSGHRCRWLRLRRWRLQCQQGWRLHLPELCHWNQGHQERWWVGSGPTTFTRCTWGCAQGGSFVQGRQPGPAHSIAWAPTALARRDHGHQATCGLLCCRSCRCSTGLRTRQGRGAGQIFCRRHIARHDCGRPCQGWRWWHQRTGVGPWRFRLRCLPGRRWSTQLDARSRHGRCRFCCTGYRARRRRGRQAPRHTCIYQARWSRCRRRSRSNRCRHGPAWASCRGHSHRDGYRRAARRGPGA